VNLNDNWQKQQMNQMVNNTALTQNWMNSFLEQYDVKLSQKPQSKSNSRAPGPSTFQKFINNGQTNPVLK